MPKFNVNVENVTMVGKNIVTVHVFFVQDGEDDLWMGMASMIECEPSSDGVKALLAVETALTEWNTGDHAEQFEVWSPHTLANMVIDKFGNAGHSISLSGERVLDINVI
jgi:hypothetical protein